MIRLTRVAPGMREARVVVRGTSIETLLTVHGPDREAIPGFEWMVSSDRERFFPTLREARQYINRFFEPVEVPSIVRDALKLHRQTTKLKTFEGRRNAKIKLLYAINSMTAETQRQYFDALRSCRANATEVT